MQAKYMHTQHELDNIKWKLFAGTLNIRIYSDWNTSGLRYDKYYITFIMPEFFLTYLLWICTSTFFINSM